MTDEQALTFFRRWVDRFALKQDAAAHLGISKPYLTDLYRGARPMTDKILLHIGLRRETIIKQGIA